MDSSLHKSDLIDLQDMDLKIDSFLNEKKSSDIVQSLKYVEQEYGQLIDNLVQIDESLNPYNIKVKEYEGALEKYQISKENNLKSQSNSNVPSELTNYMLKEKEINNNIDNLEKEMDTLVEKYREYLDDKARLEIEMKQLKEHLVLQSKEVLNYWKSIDKKIEDSKTDRDLISSKIPAKYVDRYELLRKSEKIVVGYINEDQCGICGFLLSSNEIAKINSGDEDQCSSCGGILL
jgi:predicted  nucleic acid-binding Zn-ribbon protein